MTSKKAVTFEKFRAMITLAKEQKWDVLERDFPGDWLRYGKVLKSQYWRQTLADDIPQAEHIWLYGPSHTGKSSIVKLLFPDVFYKRPDEWWDGYLDQSTVYLGDMDPPSFQKVGMNNLKVWADPQGFSANKKYGGSDHVVLHQVLVTSNFRIHECMKYDLQGGHQILEAIRNRFKEVRISDFLRQYGIRLRPAYQLAYLKDRGNCDYSKLFEYIGESRQVKLNPVEIPLHVERAEFNKNMPDLEDIAEVELEQLLDDTVEFNNKN